MPPDLPNEQELILKKRARRRLVGAIALVLLMIIVLPMVLKDRAVPDSQESIKISMPATKTEEFNSTVVPLDGQIEAPKPEEGAAVDDSPADTTSAPVIEDKQQVKQEVKKEVKPAEVKQQVKEETKAAAQVPAKAITAKPVEKKPEPVKTPEPAQTKSAESFIVQIGVFSDAANVKQLQEKLKQTGYVSHTEKITTPKGEKIRLRTSSFSTRQDADAALNKIKQAGLSGLVMPNT